MGAVKMWIEKFGREVTIDDGHPLAVEQRARDADKSASKVPVPNIVSHEHTATHSDDATLAAATVAPASDAADSPVAPAPKVRPTRKRR